MSAGVNAHGGSEIRRRRARRALTESGGEVLLGAAAGLGGTIFHLHNVEGSALFEASSRSAWQAFREVFEDFASGLVECVSKRLAGPQAHAIGIA